MVIQQTRLPAPRRPCTISHCIILYYIVLLYFIEKHYMAIEGIKLQWIVLPHIKFRIIGFCGKSWLLRRATDITVIKSWNQFTTHNFKEHVIVLLLNY